jgi:hypothetical protein
MTSQNTDTLYNEVQRLRMIFIHKIGDTMVWQRERANLIK